MTGLEALESIRDFKITTTSMGGPYYVMQLYYKEELDIIEEELKLLEKYRETDKAKGSI